MAMEALRKETMQYEELRKALEYDEDLKTLMSHQYSQVADALDGDTGAQRELEESSELRRKLFVYTVSLVVDMQKDVDRRKDMSRRIQQCELDEQAPQRSWRDWARGYRKCVRSWNPVQVKSTNVQHDRSTNELVQVVRVQLPHTDNG
jgi:hypothetical protein